MTISALRINVVLMLSTIVYTNLESILITALVKNENYSIWKFTDLCIAPLIILLLGIQFPLVL